MARIKFKGSAARALDAWYRRGNVANNLTLAQGHLRSGAPFEDVTKALGTAGRGDPAFRYPHSAVLRGPDFERVARRGYLEAIDLALAHNPPVRISTFWMTGTDIARFDVVVANRADLVEVTVLVPGVEIDAADAAQHGLTDVQEQD